MNIKYLILYHFVEAPWKQESLAAPGPKPLPPKPPKPQEPGNIGVPYWLIEGHRDCMKIVTLGIFKVLCLHPIRPQNCKDEVWNTLVELIEMQEVVTCPTEGMFNSVFIL